MNIPITGASQVLEFLLLLIAWLYIRKKITANPGTVLPSIRLLHKYFFYFAIFNAFMSVPYIMLYVNEDWFPPAMAWGYIIGNIALVLSLSYLSRMATAIIPALANREKLVTIVWAAINAILTILHVLYVGIRFQPTYDYETRLTNFDFPPFLGGILSTISLLAYIPVIVLFTMSAVRNRGDKRLRSGLLAAGMLLIMIAGPLHALAANWQVFLVADILNVISLSLLCASIVYQLNEAPSVAARPVTA